jgi:hypothetical protein
MMKIRLRAYVAIEVFAIVVISALNGATLSATDSR